MKWSERILKSFRHAVRQPPKPGRVVMPRREDSIRDYPSAGLTPSRLIAVLQEADAHAGEDADQGHDDHEF